MTDLSTRAQRLLEMAKQLNGVYWALSPTENERRTVVRLMMDDLPSIAKALAASDTALREARKKKDQDLGSPGTTGLEDSLEPTPRRENSSKKRIRDEQTPF